MDELTHDQAVVMDLIIGILTNSCSQIPGNNLGPDDFARQLKISEAEAKHLIIGIIKGIRFEGHPVVDHVGEEYPEITVNYNTPRFIEWGGFTKYYQIQLEKEAQEAANFDLQYKINKGQIEQFTLNKNQFILAIIVAISGWIAFIISLFHK